MSESGKNDRTSDRNLLFGVLALQVDLLDAGRFAEACSAWSARKNTPLASLLVERGWLTPEDRADVDRLLERKLSKHNGDVQASLAEVMSESTRKTLSNVADPDLHRTLNSIPAVDDPHEKTTTNYEPVGRERYTLTRVHARGGIGQVWLARDTDLGRDVALKELLGSRSDHPAVVARFIEEAKITGQLEHPNIVPVYELARPAGENSSPFYTMRFVRGRTLAAAIKEYHRKRQEKQAGPLELRQLLSHLIAVCNAVSYAHSRGVLHRDLKPGNVVVGDYGEVIVLDWGLAKLKGAADPQTSLMPVSVNRDYSREGTMQGQALGTPSYMPPEQAEGRQELIGERSDVYGLGAILYEILTGEPPFEGPDTPSVLVQVVTDPPVPPRRKVAGTSRPLESVCLRALEKKAADRYASAKDFSEELERWLADEPVMAWREAWPTRAYRWARRHRTLVTGISAACLVALLLSGGIIVVREQERARGRAVAEESLARAKELMAKSRWAEARAALDRADDRLAGTTTDALLMRLDDTRRDLELVVRIENIRAQQAGVFRAPLDNTARVDQLYESAFREAESGGPGDDPEAIGARIAESAVRDSLVAALDDWAMKTYEPERQRWILAVARKADADTIRDRLRDPDTWNDPNELARLTREVAVENLTPGLAAMIGLRIENSGDAGERLLREAQARRPQDYWFNWDLSCMLLRKNRPAEGEAFARAAIAARPDNAAAHDNLGNMLYRQGRFNEAANCYRKTLELDPGFALALLHLASVSDVQGRLEEATALCRKAVQIEPTLGPAHGGLGYALLRQGKLEEALACYRQAIEIEHADGPAHVAIGDLFRANGRKTEAEDFYQEAIRINPNEAGAYNALARLRDEQGRLAEASNLYRKVIELTPNPSASHYINPGWAAYRQRRLDEAKTYYQKALLIEPDNAVVHNDLGLVLATLGEKDGAADHYRKAIDLDPNYFWPRSNLGLLLMSRGRPEEAASQFRKASELNPTNAWPVNNVGWSLMRQGRSNEAPEYFRKAIEIDPGCYSAYFNLGEVLLGQGKTEEGIRLLQKVFEIDPRDAERNYDIAASLAMLGRRTEAVAFLRKSVELDPSYAEAYTDLAASLIRQGRAAEALAACEKAIAIDAKLADTESVANTNLAKARLGLAQYAAAREALSRTQASGASRNNESEFRRTLRQAALGDRLEGVLRGSDNPANAMEALDFAVLCRYQWRLADAVRLYKKAFAIDPKCADDLKAGHRFSAACCAALAACGTGKESPGESDEERSVLHRRALNWLRADLSIYARWWGNTPAQKAEVVRTLSRWLTDDDLVAVRDPAGLAKLPEADRKRWQLFWAEVDATLDAVPGAK